MLFMLCRLGEDRYALPAVEVVSVLPMLALKSLPMAAPGIAGLFEWQGRPVPALDLKALALGKPALPRLSTRIVLLRVPGEDGQKHLIGLIAEQAGALMRRPPGEFQPSGVRADGAPWLGPVVSHEGELVQWVRPEHILPLGLRAELFRAVEET